MTNYIVIPYVFIGLHTTAYEVISQIRIEVRINYGMLKVLKVYS